MKTLLLTLLLISLTAFKSQACINYYYTVDGEGHLNPADDIERAFNTNFNFKLIEKKLIKLEKQFKDEMDYKLLSDYAVLLLKGGKVEASLKILEGLYQEYPYEYKIVSNLGTAYEINGELFKAIRFIEKGIDINPNSHGGSEWVHLQVLKTKSILLEHADYLKDHTVLNLSETDKRDSLVRNQILIQVRERFPFSPGLDLIMASILIDLGDCYANTASIEYAKALYTIAREYYGAENDLVENKINEMIKLRGKYKDVKPEKRTHEASYLKISGMSYRKLLDDNNPNDYEIKWDKIDTSSKDLLAVVDITIYAPKLMDILSEEECNKQDQMLKKELTEEKMKLMEAQKKRQRNIILYGILGFILLGGLIALIIVKK
jgi:tetratricopeptide (TPR) repeat protein